jgi:hypothetical protein
MSGSELPAPEGIYCLTCRYDLRGLTSNRCPECGRAFDPGLASTYTRYPSRTKELEDRVYQTIVGFLRDPKQGQRFTASVASLWRQQSRLAAENVELRATLAALEQLLVEKGLVSEEEIRDRVHRLGLFETTAQTDSEQIAEWLNQMVSNPAAEDDSINLDDPLEP